MTPCFLAQVSIDETARQQVVLLLDREHQQQQLLIDIGLMEAEKHRLAIK